MSGKVDNLWVRDSLVADVVSAGEGREVNARAASDYIVRTLERLDRKQSDAKQRPTTTKKDGAVEAEYRRRTGQDMPKASIDRSPKERAIMPVSAYEQAARRRIAQRLREINSCPDLRQRMKGLAVGLNSTKKDARERAALEVEKLFEETNRLFGDWRKPKSKKLVFG